MDETFPANTDQSPAAKPEMYLPRIAIEELPAFLGFNETDDLKTLATQMLEAVKAGDWPAIHRLKGQYQELAEAQSEEHKDQLDRDKSVIGSTVAIGLIYKNGGRDQNYGAELQNAHQFAWNLRLPYVVDVLEAAMAQVGEEVETRQSWSKESIEPDTISENYLSELANLSKQFEAEAPAVRVSLQANHLMIDGQLPDAVDHDPAKIWRALTDGRPVIARELAAYREQLKAKDSNLTVDPDTPLQVVQLGKHPRDVLTPEAFGRATDQSEHEFSNLADVKEEFRPYWQAIQAAGLKPKVRLFATRSGWWPVFLWSNSQPAFEVLRNR